MAAVACRILAIIIATGLRRRPPFAKAFGVSSTLIAQ